MKKGTDEEKQIYKYQKDSITYFIHDLVTTINANSTLSGYAGFNIFKIYSKIFMTNEKKRMFFRKVETILVWGVKKYKWNMFKVVKTLLFTFVENKFLN